MIPPTQVPTEGPVPTVSPVAGVDRPGVYEAMIRELVGAANAGGSQTIHVRAELCSNLLSDRGCDERLTPEEQRGLAAQLGDLGSVIFQNDGDPWPMQGGVYLLGPILHTPDGLRVEGGSICGGDCGSGAMYIVEATDTGYQVAGKDRSYGEWIS